MNQQYFIFSKHMLPRYQVGILLKGLDSTPMPLKNNSKLK